MKKVLVIIPTYNEVSNIGSVIDAVEIIANTKPYTFKLLILDDSSPDGTASMVKSLQKKYKNIDLLIGQRAGLGAAYLRGLRHALDHYDFDYLIMMDADLSHDPKDIPRLLLAIEYGADYAIGSRYTIGGSVDQDWPISRQIMSSFANFIAKRLVGFSEDIDDMTSGFKAVRRTALEHIELDSISANGYIFQVSLLHSFVLQGFRVKEIPIKFTGRNKGRSKLKLRDIIEFLYRSYKLNPNAPIQRFVRFGLVGLSGTVVNLAVLATLVRYLHIETLLADIIAIECSIISNFLLNHFYTFKGYGAYPLHSRRESVQSLIKKLAKFNVGTLGGAAISFVLFSLLFKLIHVQYLLADAIAIIISMSWNYFVSTRYVWKSIDE